MSTSNGFAAEAIGRDATFIDRMMNLFGNIPILSHWAYLLVCKLGMQDDAADLVPKVSFVMLAFLIGLTPIFFKIILHIWLITTRTFTKGSDANARWATFGEIYRNFTIPSHLSYFLHAYFIVITSIMVLDAIYRWYLPFPILVFGSIPLAGMLRLLLGPYSQIRKESQPYPLGKYHGMNIYLTGGKRWSILRGKAEEQRQSHIMITGPTGTFKTTGFFIPGILEDARNNCSAIVVEAKASAQEDMFKTIAPTWAAAGKKIMLFDPWSDATKAPKETIAPTKADSEAADAEPATKETDACELKESLPCEGNVDYDHGSLSFNPLLGLNASFRDPVTRDTIEYVVDAIYRTYETEKGAASGDASYHVGNELDLIKGLMTITLFKPEAQRNLAALAEICKGTLQGAIEYIESTLNTTTTTKEVQEDIKKNLQWFTEEGNLQVDKRASMLRGIAGKLSVFTHPRVVPHVTNNELDLDMVFKEPTLLCIKAPVNVPGASTLASMIIRLLMMKVPNKLSYGAGKDFKVFFYLDELPALSIPKFNEFCKTARSSGTGIIAAIQDRPDVADIISATLGINSIDSLLANFMVQVYLPGLSLGTAEHLSKSFGKTAIKTRRTVRSTLNPIDFNYFTAKEEKLLTQPDNIKYMKPVQCLIVHRNIRPFYATTTPWFNSMKYKSIVKKNKDVKIGMWKKSGTTLRYESPKLLNFNDTIDPAKVKKYFAKKRDITNELINATQQVPKFVGPKFTESAHDGLSHIDDKTKLEILSKNPPDDFHFGSGTF